VAIWPRASALANTKFIVEQIVSQPGQIDQPQPGQGAATLTLSREESTSQLITTDMRLARLRECAAEGERWRAEIGHDGEKISVDIT
jgi:hypothetical protein